MEEADQSGAVEVDPLAAAVAGLSLEAVGDLWKAGSSEESW